jgi:2-(1,2-epoxy-1,2-dihydrophenyl)acetyl-CoA isomerase
MSDSELQLEVRAGVARITINRPLVMNAINTRMWATLLDMVQSIEHDDAVRCLLLSGAGENFCAGGDVQEFSSTLAYSDAERARFWMRSADVTNAMFVALERIPQPVVVSARGVGAGGGMALVAAADLCIASDTARFFAAQIKIGAIPDSGVSYNMVRSLGLKRAKQYGMLGEMMDAKTALEIGFVNWVVPNSALEERTEALVTKLVRMPATALALTKSTFNAACNESLCEHFVQEARDVGACVTAPDYPERVRAFIERQR